MRHCFFFLSLILCCKALCDPLLCKRKRYLFTYFYLLTHLHPVTWLAVHAVPGWAVGGFEWGRRWEVEGKAAWRIGRHQRGTNQHP